MSFRASRRRRRGGRRSAALAGDPLDLFLDAITNALGVIMFILLMVVLFGRAGESHSESTAPVAADVRLVRDLEEERKDLQAKIDALPPAGDPALAARWKAANERLPKLEDEITQLRSEVPRKEAALAAAAAALAADRRIMEKLESEASTKSVAVAKPAGFVRVSMFKQDTRKSVILTLNDGKISRFRATPGAEQVVISPPTAGQLITDAASATAAVGQLLDGFQPTTHTVDLIVWEGSFRQAKLVEQAILDRGFDSNPLPVLAGKNIESDKKSKGGAQ